MAKHRNRTPDPWRGTGFYERLNPEESAAWNAQIQQRLRRMSGEPNPHATGGRTGVLSDSGMMIEIEVSDWEILESRVSVEVKILGIKDDWNQLEVELRPRYTSLRVGDEHWDTVHLVSPAAGEYVPFGTKITLRLGLMRKASKRN